MSIQEIHERLGELTCPIERIPGAVERGDRKAALQHVDALLREVTHLHSRMHKSMLAGVVKEQQREHYTEQAREARGEVA